MRDEMNKLPDYIRYICFAIWDVMKNFIISRELYDKTRAR